VACVCCVCVTGWKSVFIKRAKPASRGQQHAPAFPSSAASASAVLLEPHGGEPPPLVIRLNNLQISSVAGLGALCLLAFVCCVVWLSTAGSGSGSGSGGWWYSPTPSIQREEASHPPPAPPPAPAPPPPAPPPPEAGAAKGAPRRCRQGFVLPTRTGGGSAAGSAPEGSPDERCYNCVIQKIYTQPDDDDDDSVSDSSTWDGVNFMSCTCSDGSAPQPVGPPDSTGFQCDEGPV
jgi:hypothetical protein